MITSSLDILYLALAIAAIILTIFIAITLAYAIFILRDISKVLSDVQELVGRVNDIVLKPLKFISTISSYIKPFIEKAKKKYKN